jgi:hypothetical protein
MLRCSGDSLSRLRRVPEKWLMPVIAAERSRTSPLDRPSADRKIAFANGSQEECRVAGLKRNTRPKGQTYIWSWDEL